MGTTSERKDSVKCRHYKERVTAKIVRVFPEAKRPKMWTFDGALRQDDTTLVGVFLGNKDNLNSYGVIFMTKTDADTFKGNYFRWIDKEVDGETPTTVVREIKKIPLEWRRP